MPAREPPEPAGLDPSSRARLTPHTAARFTGETLFAELARTICQASCLPRKELYEAWEVARRVRRRWRGGVVVDAPAGHGLLAWILLILDDSSPRAIQLDRRRPASNERLREVLEERWPRLRGRVEFREQDLADAELPGDALVASVHACGPLTDRVLDLALRSRARVAVLPCCHDLERCDTGQLEGWLAGPLAVAAPRAARLRAAGYAVRTQTIPAEITPQNRLLMGAPGPS